MRLGIDIGGTKTAAVVLDRADQVLAAATEASGRGPRGVVAVAADVAGRALAQLDQGHPRIERIGACMPGLVDPTTGQVRHAVNLDVEFLSLASELGALLGQPVAVENDVKSAALGAARILGDRAPETLGYLNLGTGLAAALVRDGRLVRGVAGAAGEIGHLPVGGAAPCSCGQTGCLETIASGTALARLWPAGADAADPFAAAASGDDAARLAVDELCRGIALAIQLLVLGGGALHVAIGGGLASLGPRLTEGIRARLDERAELSSLIEALDLSKRFELLDSAEPLAALGAAHLTDLSS